MGVMVSVLCFLIARFLDDGPISDDVFVGRSSIARMMRALTNPLITEYGSSHFALTLRSAICFSTFLASRPIRPSVETTNSKNPPVLFLPWDFSASPYDRGLILTGKN
jgi:hypothetical protein